MFGAQAATETIRRAPMLNAFLAAAPTRGKSADRPRTSSTARQSIMTDSDSQSPVTGNFPMTPVSASPRTDSGYALHTSLREKKSGHFDSLSKRSFSGSNHMLRKASIPFVKHSPTLSSSTTLSNNRNGSTYAPSTYAQSTLAASTIMPGLNLQPVQLGEGTSQSEGHWLQWRAGDGPSTCVLCDDKAQDGYYRCSGCGFVVHDRCAGQISIVCSAAFYPDQVRAAFARCMASLFYTYRKFMQPAHVQKRKLGSTYKFDNDAFIKSLPPDHATYMEVLRQTQAWNEFIMDREEKVSKPSIALFDAVIAAKRGRAGLRSSLANMAFNRRSFSPLATSATPRADILSDTSQHQWRIVAVPSSSVRPDLGAAANGRDYHTIITRKPAKLEEGLFQAEAKVPDLPAIPKKSRMSVFSSKLNGLGMHAP